MKRVVIFFLSFVCVTGFSTTCSCLFKSRKIETSFAPGSVKFQRVGKNMEGSFPEAN